MIHNISSRTQHQARAPIKDVLVRAMKGRLLVTSNRQDGVLQTLAGAMRTHALPEPRHLAR